MANRFWLSLWLFLLPLMLFGCWQIGLSLSRIQAGNQEKATLIQAMNLLESWFKYNQTEKGDFVYELQVNSGQATQNYNIVRQAGSFYSLAQLNKFKHDPELKATLEKGFAFFSPLLQPQSNATHSAAVIFNKEKQTNSSAVFLLALIEFIEAEPANKDNYLPQAQALANFLVSTQKDNGGFANWPDENQNESDYNNGETFYALVRMYNIDSNPTYLTAAKKAAAYFLQYYPTSFPNMSFYSWGMSGFAYLYQLDPQESYWQFMRQSTEAVITKQGQNILGAASRPESLKAGWGVFLEGVAHVAWIASDKDPAYYYQLKTFYLEALKILLTLQVNGPFSVISSGYENVSGGMCYDARCQTQRIDITHHNLSAIYLYLQFFGPKAESA